MNTERKNEIIAVLLFAAGLFLFLSLVTFSERDLAFYTSNPNAGLWNATGILGALVGGFFHFFMGHAAYVIPLLMLLWGMAYLFQIETRRIYFKFFGTLILVTAVSTSLSLMTTSGKSEAFSQGGLIGSMVSGFLLSYLGRIGATVFISALVILSVLIATEFMILPMVLGLGRLMKKTVSDMDFKDISLPKISLPAARNPFKSSRPEVSKKLASIKQQVEAVKRTSFLKKENPLKALLAETAPPREKAESRPELKIVAMREKEPPKQAERPMRVAPVSNVVTGEKLEYKLPGLSLLKDPVKGNQKESDDDLKQKAATLERTLFEFGVEAKVVQVSKGPVITLFELEPAMGTHVNKITSLNDNIAMAMHSSNIRIIAPLPGKGTIGIEVPNTKRELVYLKDILSTTEYIEDDSPLKLALGKDISGETIIADLTKMPHLLIAGTTGSGKTVCLNSVITSLLFNSSPDEVKFLMIDPKRVELMMFEGIPHLVSPIVTTHKKAASALSWVVWEMDRRYEIFGKKGVRNIASYNEKKNAEELKLPYIVVIVDELADLMQLAQADVEGAITRIAQLSRAAGIHMILATQRPSVNVITGVIKANFPARISFQVASKVDSRTVLDVNGADKLLGRGDMLFMQPGESNIIRGQCGMVEDAEIRNLVKFIKDQAPTQYIEEAVEKLEKKHEETEQKKDDLYFQAVKIVVETKQASVSMIQRKLSVGYTRAARMIDIMEVEGIVGPYNGSKPREILVDSVKELEGQSS